MDKRRLHAGMRQIGETQRIQLARDALQLADARQHAVKAGQAVDGHIVERDALDHALESLLAGAAFCPDRYRIACGALLGAEARLSDSRDVHERCQIAEDNHERQWFQSSRQLEWLDNEVATLGRKLARDADDRSCADAVAVRRAMDRENAL